MAIYELRTYAVIVGKMSEVISHYKNEGWPALAKHPQKLVGYFTGDVGALNELIHVGPGCLPTLNSWLLPPRSVR
jgi:NIPSNAP